MKDVLENIKRIRESGGYSQNQLSELLNINQSKYARFESGKSKTDLKTIKLFADFFKMSVIDVITYPDKYVNINQLTDDKKNKNEPEVIVQIKLKEDKKEQVLKLIFGDTNLEILNK